MRDIESIVKDVAKIYRESGKEAEEYLRKARRLKERFGPGLAIVYCWFYSVPQKWIQIERKVFELIKLTNGFELNTMLTMESDTLAKMLKPMIFYNEIARGFKNFCFAVRNEYGCWNNFSQNLKNKEIFKLFKELKRYRGIRITFKNLSAMKIFVGMEDNLLIVDKHVAGVLGLDKNEVKRYKVQEMHFKNLLKKVKKVTNQLRTLGFKDICPAKWSLAIWFNQTKIRANKLLVFNR